MIAIVHSIYSQSVHAPARDAGLMDNDAERYCTYPQRSVVIPIFDLSIFCIGYEIHCVQPSDVVYAADVSVFKPTILANLQC